MADETPDAVTDPRTQEPRIEGLHIADDPQAWTELGFRVDDGTCRIGTVDLVLTGTTSGRGITGWVWSGVAPEGRPAEGSLGRITTRYAETASTEPAVKHPNTAIGMFYVVLFGPSHGAAVSAMDAMGTDVSKPIRLGMPSADDESVRLRSLAPAGGIEVEVIGPETPDPNGKWRLWGVIIEVADIDALAEQLGERLRPIKPAVQQGRRIATLDKSAGSSVAIAFMSGVE